MCMTMPRKNDENDAYCVATVLINQLHTLLEKARSKAPDKVAVSCMDCFISWQ